MILSHHSRLRSMPLLLVVGSVLLINCKGFTTTTSLGYHSPPTFTSHFSFGVRDAHEKSTTTRPLAASTTTTTTVTNSENDVDVTPTDLLNEETIDAIAGRLENLIDIPLIPDFLVSLTWTNIVERLSNDLDSSLMNEIQILLNAEATNTRVDDATVKDVIDLSKRIAADLHEKDTDGSAFQLPYLSKEQELYLLQRIVEVMLRVLTVRKTERRVKGITISIDLTKKLLESSETRQMLADKLNDRIDLPILNEEIEGKIFLQSVESASQVLASLLPPEVVTGLLQKQNPDGIEELKQHMVNRMMNLLRLPEAARPFQQSLVDNMVELVMEDLFGSKGELFLMNWEEQREFYEERRALFYKQMMLGRQTYKEEQEHFRQQIEALTKRIEGLDEKLQNLDP